MPMSTVTNPTLSMNSFVINANPGIPRTQAPHQTAHRYAKNNSFSPKSSSVMVLPYKSTDEKLNGNLNPTASGSGVITGVGSGDFSGVGSGVCVGIGVGVGDGVISEVGAGFLSGVGSGIDSEVGGASITGSGESSVTISTTPQAVSNNKDITIKHKERIFETIIDFSPSIKVC